MLETFGNCIRTLPPHTLRELRIEVRSQANADFITWSRPIKYALDLRIEDVQHLVSIPTSVKLSHIRHKQDEQMRLDDPQLKTP
jgi:hypothetical protein